MDFSKFSTLFRQLGVLRGTRLLLCDASVRLLDSGRRSAYSQTGEDLALNWFLGSGPGFYVDVGCNHPKYYSNTYALYKAGWTGICIDANETLIRQFASLRPRDTAVCEAISDNEGDVTFTDFEDALVSSLDAEHVARFKRDRAVKRERQVRTRTLTAVLDELDAPRCFDLLSIDVEGHDEAVLRSIDLQRYKPRVIIVEMHAFNPESPQSSGIFQYLSARDYRLAGFLIMNGFFVKRET